VAGLYAYLMLAVHDLTGEPRYLEEAKVAARTMEGLRFGIGYQFNNTAWGANACLRLYKVTGDDLYLGISHVCLASIFHNTFLWECNYGYAKDYSTFLGLAPLKGGTYLAAYEEYEVFTAFHEYLSLTGEEIPNSIRAFLAEYCKYVLSRTWSYYPSQLPEDALADEVQNGRICRHLAIPLEDIYDGWRQAGQVGQEVYGSGAAFAFVVRSYHHLEGAPFLLYCAYPAVDIRVDADAGRASFGIREGSIFRCRMRLIPSAGEPLPATTVCVSRDGKEEACDGADTPEGHREYFLPGESTTTIVWETTR
jgi:hypothetical protein